MMAEQCTPTADDELSAEVREIAAELDRIEPVMREALIRAFRSELLRARIKGRTTDKTGGHYAH